MKINIAIALHLFPQHRLLQSKQIVVVDRDDCDQHIFSTTLCDQSRLMLTLHVLEDGCTMRDSVRAYMSSCVGDLDRMQIMSSVGCEETLRLENHFLVFLLYFCFFFFFFKQKTAYEM